MVATGGGRPIPATVAGTPFFDPAGLRLRGTTEYSPKDSAAPGSSPSSGPKTRKPRPER